MKAVFEAGPVQRLIRSEALVGRAAIAVLCTIIAGANLPNPLAPEYVGRFGVTPLMQSALFSTYLLALVVTLAVLVGRKGRRLGPEQLLLISVTAALLANFAFSLGSQLLPALFIGRLLSGLAVALATGSAASVALARLGERARTAVATSAILGSLLGNLGGGAMGAVLPQPAATTYLAHCAVLICLAIPFLLSTGDTAQTGAVTTYLAEQANKTPYRLRHRLAGFVLGGTAWGIAGAVLALVPAALSKADPSLSLLGSVLPVGVFLASAWIGQILTRGWIARLRAWQVLIPMLAGMALMGAALQKPEMSVVLFAAAISGFGQGPAYSLGLATVSHGLGAQRQGNTASFYSGVAYACCGVVVLAAGAVGTAVSVSTAILWVAALFAIVGTTIIGLAGAPQERATGPDRSDALPQQARFEYRQANVTGCEIEPRSTDRAVTPPDTVHWQRRSCNR
jgi:Major Facilitator Superfamily